jgi:hypothetical protein
MLSIIEAIYLFYMFHCFETTIDFGITPSPNGYWFTHMTGSEKGLRICPFGRVAILFLIAILLLRPKFLRISLIIAFFLSLINLNALVYLLPVFIIEYYRIL